MTIAELPSAPVFGYRFHPSGDDDYEAIDFWPETPRRYRETFDSSAWRVASIEELICRIVKLLRGAPAAAVHFILGKIRGSPRTRFLKYPLSRSVFHLPCSRGSR